MDKETPRAFTEDEVREKFLEHVREIADYWANQHEKSTRERVSGAVFSVLVALDGEAADLPGFTVSPLPSSYDDIAFDIEHGENWYSAGLDIAGSLHNGFYK
jgi:hypothetical protein